MDRPFTPLAARASVSNTLAPQVTSAPAASPAREKQLEAIYAAIVDGNLAKLTAEQRLVHYKTLCEGLGLNPLTKPFGFYEMKGEGGKPVVHVYALKEAAAQLARRDCVSVEIVRTEWFKEQALYEVWARATSSTRNNYGEVEKRITDEVGAVALAETAKADGAGVQRMKAVTKARRRAILAHCGLGLLDESEIESIDGARRISADEFLSGRETVAPERLPAQTPGAASVRVAQPFAQETLPVQEAMFESLEDEKKPAHEFDSTSPADMEWLIKTLKTHFPNSARPLIVQLAEAFKHLPSRAEIDAEILKRVAAKA